MNELLSGMQVMDWRFRLGTDAICWRKGIAKGVDELKGRGSKRLATSEEYAVAEAQLRRGQIKVYIQGVFLSLTSLICLFAIYTALTG